MTLKHKKYRLQAFEKQKGKCFYCQSDMWEQEHETRDQARERLGITPGAEGAGKTLRRALCTAEHLKKRVEGGKNGRGNIVAACLWCNVRRGNATPEEHMQRMRCAEVGL